MKTRVAVLFGGRSVEHEVAIISGVQAMRYLDTEKYEVFPVYLGKEGEMLYSKDFQDINAFKHCDLTTLRKTYP
ncbi:MAG: D-alanine--D-alanine ligase, partial [Clostridia bacterium]|nr:D-alanine--D-alanine ligase [Clostridia bacterium]